MRSECNLSLKQAQTGAETGMISYSMEIKGKFSAVYCFSPFMTKTGILGLLNRERGGKKGKKDKHTEEKAGMNNCHKMTMVWSALTTKIKKNRKTIRTKCCVTDNHLVGSFSSVMYFSPANRRSSLLSWSSPSKQWDSVFTHHLKNLIELLLNYLWVTILNS